MKRGKWRERGTIFLLLWLTAAALLLTGRSVSAASFTGEPLLRSGAAAKESAVEIRFMSRAGTVYGSLTRQLPVGSTLVLPAVPGYEGAKNSGWKLEKNAPDTDGLQFAEGETVTLSAGESLMDYAEGGVLYFYAIEPYTLTLWNNAGTSRLQQLRVFPGSAVKLPNISGSKYVNYGWTDVKKGTAVKYKIGQSFTVKKAANLYIIRYSVSKLRTVTFYGPGGGTNSKFQAINAKVVQGQTFRLPEVPAAAGYTNLGWATKKNASKAGYAAGSVITVKKNMTFYAVRKKLPVYKLTFNNNSGTSTSSAYAALAVSAYKGQSVVLPEVPAAKGYTSLGWTTVRKGKTVKYKAGARVTVTKNMKFYAVRKKTVYYTVSFYNSDGSSGSAFTALKKKAASGSAVTLPALPSRSGYVALGWGTAKNASAASYQAGATLKITKDTVLYAVYKSAVTVTLYKNDGTVYKTMQVGKGDYFVFPAVQSKLPYTMMGWSSAKGKTLDPEYEAGDSLRIISDRKFYAVVFNRNREPNLLTSSMPELNISKYRKVIFVGDSRTRRMSLALSRLENAAFLDKTVFLAKDGAGLGWLMSDGYAQLKKELGDGGGLPAAVIFNLGINDLTNAENYVSYLQGIAAELKSYGCQLYYMSVNPINSENIKAAGKGSRREETVRTFNSVIRSELCSGTDASCTYIDLYTYLLKNGYGTDGSSSGTDTGIDDGLHYTEKTYKRIYKYCIDFLNQR